MIIFGSVFKKKNNQTKIFLKKITETGLVRFFRTKTGSNRFGLVFPFLLGFFQFGSVFFLFFSVWFFRFQAYKTETEPNWSVFSKF